MSRSSPVPGGSSRSTTVTPPSLARTAFTLRLPSGSWKNIILVVKNAIPEGPIPEGPIREGPVPRGKDIAARIAAETLAKRGPDYTPEVRRLLDAALEVIGRHGTTSRARVADI